MGLDARSQATRESALIGAVLIAFLGLVWSEAGAFLDDSPPDFPAQQARHFDLPGGRPEIAVSASDEDDILVRWRNADGKTWTEPQVAYRAGSRKLTDVTYRVGGPTLALSATFTLPGRPYLDALSAKGVATDDITVFIVCRDESCTVSREYAGTLTDPPQVSKNGERVLLAQRDGMRVTWQGGSISES